MSLETVTTGELGIFVSLLFTFSVGMSFFGAGGKVEREGELVFCGIELLKGWEGDGEVVFVGFWMGGCEGNGKVEFCGMVLKGCEVDGKVVFVALWKELLLLFPFLATYYFH